MSGPPVAGSGMTNKEIMRVVNRYIGVSCGYLGDLSYRMDADFYPEYCDLDIDPYDCEGTTTHVALGPHRRCRPGSRGRRNTAFLNRA